jgi:hypothetical protein
MDQTPEITIGLDIHGQHLSVIVPIRMPENILDLPEDQRPEVFNDRGRQMKAKPIQRMLEDMKMPQ